MARTSMMFILLPFLCLIAEAQNSSTLNCLVDYKELMNCTWKDTGNNSHVSLHVYWEKLLLNNCTFTRLLPAVEEGHFHTYFCSMKITHFTRVYRYTLILKSSSQAKDFTVNNFRPCQNIQLTAPLHLSVTINSTAQNVNISWQFDVPYLSMKVQYELEYWSKETKEGVKMKSQPNDIRHLTIGKADLEPDSHYRGRVRVKPKETFYIRGLWSKWSAEITWRTGPGPNSASTKSNLLCVLFAPLLLAVIIFISLYFKLPSRVVSKVWIHIPNPASYFQPLYNQHNGNFKEWIHKNHASVQRNSSGGSSHELKEVKRVPVGRGVTVILNPWDEAVSNISYLKPIPINQTSTFDLNTKGSLQTEFSNPIQHPKKYSNNDSVLLHLIPQDEQGMSENWAVVHDPSHGTFLGTVPFEEDGEYSYSEEYCTLAHSDCSQGLVPAKDDLQLKVANKCQGEKREVAEDLPVSDNPYPTCLAVTEKSELPQEDCASERPCITTPLGQSPAEPSEPPANNKEPSLTPAIPDNSAAPSAFLSEALM